MSSSGEMLRFTCPACGTHLAVKMSMAGEKGPCPKCGMKIAAPAHSAQKPKAVLNVAPAPAGNQAPAKKAPTKNSQVNRVVSGVDYSAKKSPGEIKPMPGAEQKAKVGEPVRRLPDRNSRLASSASTTDLPQKRRKEGRTIVPCDGTLKGESEKDKNAAVLKILAAVIVVLIVVVLVTWWVNYQGA